MQKKSFGVLAGSLVGSLMMATPVMADKHGHGKVDKKNDGKCVSKSCSTASNNGCGGHICKDKAGVEITDAKKCAEAPAPGCDIQKATK